VPISKDKQSYEPTKFSTRSKIPTHLSQCVLSNRNIIFSQQFCSNQVRQLVLCEHAQSLKPLIAAYYKISAQEVMIDHNFWKDGARDSLKVSTYP